MRIAVLSDIHGNRWALEQVLQDIARRGIERIVNLGDSFYGPLDPAGTAEILLAMDIPTVRGNQDREIVQPAEPSRDSSTLVFVRKELGPEAHEWIRQLPKVALVEEEIFLFHGTPERDDRYLMWRVGPQGPVRKSPADLAGSLSAFDHPVILCGHDHVPRVVQLPEGRMVVDPGAVGLPAYVDELPYPHRMQTGTPDARYAILTHDGERWAARQIAVPYDWHAASVAALENGRPNWAEWLRTGLAGDLQPISGFSGA